MSLKTRVQPLSYRVCCLAATLLIAALGLPAFAQADASDPVLGSTTATVTPLPDGNLSVELRGQWIWSTRTGDCAAAGRAVGVAIDWNDATQAGNVVTTLNGTTIDVGAAAANGRNGVDNLVHPALPGTDTTVVANWRGGCGAVNADNHPTGVWGPQTHVYPQGTTSINVCALMYDVHVDGSGAPKSAGEITAGAGGHNGDNSAQANSNTPLGNGCFTKAITFDPRIAIAKTGPATATAGDIVTYTMTVTNPGDVAYPAGSVSVSDALCLKPPALVSTGPDASTGTLDPGDQWTYTCQVQTVVGQTLVDNVAVVTAKDGVTGKTLDEQANAKTQLTAPAGQQGVLGETVKSGFADFVSKPKKCVSKTFRLDVKGAAIAKVTFKIDGKAAKTLTNPDSAGRFRLAVNPLLRSDKRHTVTAEVEYTAASQTPKKTLKVFYKRCACISRRAFTIRLRKQFHQGLRSATVFVNGKMVRTYRGKKRLKAPIKLVGLPKGKVTVKINAVTVGGKRVTGTRHYLTCAKKLKGGIPKL